MGERRQRAGGGVGVVAAKKIKYPEGFTLIELVLATAIFTVVAAGIYSAFASGLFGYRNISGTIKAYQGARLILERINRDLRNSFAYSKEDARFIGREKELSFFTLVDSYKEKETVKEYAFVSYGLKDNKLFRLSRENTAALTEDSGVEPVEMPAELSKLSFTYFEFNPEDNSLKEIPQWTDAQGLPAAVRVDLAVKTEKGEVPFERMIFLPRYE